MVSAALTMLAVAIGATAPAPALVTPVWVAQGAFCEPETVLAIPGDLLLVSNVCGYATEGSGYVSALSAEGELLSERLIDGLDSPLGMARREDRLYVVDRNRIRVFHGAAYVPEGIISLPSRVANDIAASDDGRLFVTDTAAGHVYVVASDGKTSTLTSKPAFPGANGIALDGDLLWVGGERLWRIHLPSRSITEEGPPWLTDIDGIEVVSEQVLQVTPVDGPVVELVDGRPVSITTAAGAGSANHGYHPSTDLVLIPTGFDNRVVALRLPRRSEERGGATPDQP